MAVSNLKSIGTWKYFNEALRNTFVLQRSFSSRTDEYRSQKVKPFESIPKVAMFPLIGSAWIYLPYIGKYSVEKMHVADIHKHMTYGDMVREKFGRFEVVNCYDPDAMYTIMKDDEYPSRGDFASLKAYRNRRKGWYPPGGLLVTEGKEWKASRDAIQAYTSKPEFLEFYLNSMSEIASDFVELIRQDRDAEKEIDDAVSYLNKWALEAVSFVALDKRLGCLLPHLKSSSDAMKMIEAIEVQLDCMNKLEASAGNIPLWKYLPTPTWRKFVRAADTFSTLAFDYLTRSAYEAIQQKGERPSLLQHLARTEKAGVSSMILMIDMMMAGIDTTSCTAGFFLYDLARHPEKQEEAIKEVKKLLPTKEAKLTFETYKELKYLKNCLKESMRLHPIARGNIRIFKDDVVICGYRIPAGTAVLCVLQVVYRNQKYFPMPTEFMPERWDDGKAYPFFQPFGYGARDCIGNKSAELEILTMATEVLRNFTLEYHHEDIDMTTKLINTPDRPIRLTLQEH